MQYLSYRFDDSPQTVSTYDEMPFWSAAFGSLLLKHLKLKRNLTVLDVGSGTGFPLCELAGRLGPSCKLFGLDPWKNANERAREKIVNYGYRNVTVIEASAEKIPFENNSVDLIVSNLGINNFERPAEVFWECFRVLRPGGKLALTTNLQGHWQEFYDVFESTLRSLDEAEALSKLQQHQEHRGTSESVAELFTAAGFQRLRQHDDVLVMQFADGTALLNHHFIKLGWVGAWKEMLPDERRIRAFATLEDTLNQHADRHGELRLTVPMLYMEGVK